MNNGLTDALIEANDVASLGQLLERAVKASMQNLPPPTSYRSTSLWYVLTTAEDMQRMIIGDEHAALDGMTLTLFIDQIKYSLRFAIDSVAVTTNNSAAAAIPRLVKGKSYLRAVALLKAGDQQRAARTMLSAERAGLITLQRIGAHITAIPTSLKHDPRYSCLEMYSQGPPQQGYSALVRHWTHFPDSGDQVIAVIIRATKRHGIRITYPYSALLGNMIRPRQSGVAPVIPPGWLFSWGTGVEARDLLEALAIRCAYHHFSIAGRAQLDKIAGGGVDQLLLVIHEAELARDLSETAHASIEQSIGFVRDLTHGAGTSHPDVALQPIVTLHDSLVGIPCLFYLTSNFERNLLSLQARIDKRRFDEQSHAFERRMVDDLKRWAEERWDVARCNVTVRARGQQEEVDLFIVDFASKTISACELRWMLQPGDPNEIHNRITVCREKATQLQRKLTFLHSVGIEYLLNRLGITMPSDGWVLRGVVIVEGYGGSASELSTIPVVPTSIFKQVCERSSTLAQACDFLTSLSWLPQESMHFTLGPVEAELGPWKLETPGIHINASYETYEKYVDATFETTMR